LKILITKKKQQQAPKGARVCDAAVAFYKCLEGHGLTDKHKKVLMRFSEEEVSRAVEFATHPSTKIKRSLIATIIWALQEKPDIPEKVNEIANHDLAENAETILESKFWILEAGSTRACVYSKSPYNPTSYEVFYTEQEFKNKLDKILKECEFKICQRQ